MITIIDTSVAVKWFLEEEGNDQALRVLDAVKSSPRLFAVPELFFNEMLSVLCRLLKEAKIIKDYVGALEDLGLARLGNGQDTLDLAVDFAKEFQISGYDAIYAANAKLVGGTWLTADKTAHRKIKQLKNSSFLQ